MRHVAISTRTAPGPLVCRATSCATTSRFRSERDGHPHKTKVTVAHESKAIDQPFIKAIETGNVAGARKALDAGADVNCPIYPGTALTHAIKKHAHDMIEMLLARPGIDINDGGRTFPPLHGAILVASQHKDRRWVDRLLELGADIDQMSSGWSALSQCVRHFPGIASCSSALPHRGP